MGGFLHSVGRAILSPTPVLSWVVLSLLFAVSGPFGTYEGLSFLPRSAFWLTIIGACLAAGITIRVTIQTLYPPAGYLPASFLSAAILGIALGPILPQIGLKYFGLHVTLIPSPIEVALVCLIIGSGVALLRHFLTDETRAPAKVLVEGTANHPPAPRLGERLPGDVAGRILHLSVSDHYVDVTTEKGNTRLLLRFSDAISEVAPIEGIRVHRSHWVARDAIARVERADGRLFVVLENGTRVPVSRGYRSAVEGLDHP